MDPDAIPNSDGDTTSAYVNLWSWNPFNWIEDLEVKINDFTEDLAEVLEPPECAYYFKEDMKGDYINGVNWNTAYRIFNTDPGTPCAVWYTRDTHEIDYERYHRDVEA